MILWALRPFIYNQCVCIRADEPQSMFTSSEYHFLWFMCVHFPTGSVCVPCMYGTVVKIKHFCLCPWLCFWEEVQSLLNVYQSPCSSPGILMVDRNWFLVLAVDEKDYSLTHQSPDTVHIQPPVTTIRQWHKQFSCLYFYHSRISSSIGIQLYLVACL